MDEGSSTIFLDSTWNDCSSVHGDQREIEGGRLREADLVGLQTEEEDDGIPALLSALMDSLELIDQQNNSIQPHHHIEEEEEGEEDEDSLNIKILAKTLESLFSTDQHQKPSASPLQSQQLLSDPQRSLSLNSPSPIPKSTPISSSSHLPLVKTLRSSSSYPNNSSPPSSSHIISFPKTIIPTNVSNTSTPTTHCIGIDNNDEGEGDTILLDQQADLLIAARYRNLLNNQR